MRGLKILFLLGFAILLQGCRVSYSFSGASVDYDKVKTFSVPIFNNVATLMSVSLSPNITDALVTRIQNETRLRLVSQDGDVNFQGTITGYSTAPISISAGQFSQVNRLTITVKMSFENKAQPQFSFTDKTYTSYADFETTQMLNEVEQQLQQEIIEKLVDNLFNDAFANW